MHVTVYRNSFANLFFPLCYIRDENEWGLAWDAQLSEKYLGSYYRSFPQSKLDIPEWDANGSCWDSNNNKIDHVPMRA